MRSLDRKILLHCVRQMLRALVRFCLHHSVTVQEVEGCLRQVFVEGAKKELEKKSEEVSLSRISVMTGLSRRQVQQLEKGHVNGAGTPSLLIKVVGQWQTDKKFI